MTTSDSEAYFDGRMAAMGITAPTQATMRTNGWNTMSAFAFSSAYIPGQADDKPFVDAVLKSILGDLYATFPDSSRLRRLFFEAHTLSIADLRRRSDRTESDLPVKIPVEERRVRLERLRNRLPGLEITGTMEPSHALVDSLGQQLETGVIKYLLWSTYTYRD